MATNRPTAIKQQPLVWQLIILALALMGLFFIGIGLPPLFVPDEGRYAEIGREMAVNNDFITPYLNYIKYFEKPPLYYWLTALVIKLVGAQVFFIRCINATLGLLGCLLTFFITRKLFNQRTAWLATFMLATSPLYLVMSRMVTLDLPVTFFLTACLYCFLLGTQTAVTNNDRKYFFWFSAGFAACAVLTKGLIGIVFPTIIVGLWLTVCREWRQLKTIPLFSSILVFLIIVLPWHILVTIRNPEFFYFYFIEQHFLRYTMKEIGHYQPFWYFVPVMAIGFFPWILLLPNSLHQLFIQDKNHSSKLQTFLITWILVIFLFFSFSKSKLIPYILPILPPCAILTAYFIDQALQRANVLWLRVAIWFFMVASIFIGGFFYMFPQKISLPNPAMASFYLNIASVTILLGGVASLYLSRSHLFRSVSLITLIMGCFLLLTMRALPYIDSRSILPLAHLLQKRLQTQEEVIAYNQYFQDLPFYLQRRVSILNWRNELTYGMEFQPTTEWMIDDQVFWHQFNSQKRIYFIISQAEFDRLQSQYPFQHFYVLGQTLNTLLVSNKPDQKPKM